MRFHIQAGAGLKSCVALLAGASLFILVASAEQPSPHRYESGRYEAFRSGESVEWPLGRTQDPNLTLDGDTQSAGEACFVNDGFETGNFAPWVTQDLAVPFYAMRIGVACLNPGFGLFASCPTEGNLAALHGWDGETPGTISIAQDIIVPSDVTVVSFDYRAGWDMVFGATQDRTFNVIIRPVGGGAPLQAPDLILTAGAGTTVLDTQSLFGQVDVSAFAGQAIRVSFEWFVPEEFTGPAFFQLDNVRCEVGPGECEFMDADGDGDFDLRDFARFQECFSGPK